MRHQPAPVVPAVAHPKLHLQGLVVLLLQGRAHQLSHLFAVVRVVQCAPALRQGDRIALKDIEVFVEVPGKTHFMVAGVPFPAACVQCFQGQFHFLLALLQGIQVVLQGLHRPVAVGHQVQRDAQHKGAQAHMPGQGRQPRALQCLSAHHKQHQRQAQAQAAQHQHRVGKAARHMPAIGQHGRSAQAGQAGAQGAGVHQRIDHGNDGHADQPGHRAKHQHCHSCAGGGDASWLQQALQRGQCHVGAAQRAGQRAQGGIKAPVAVQQHLEGQLGRHQYHQRHQRQHTGEHCHIRRHGLALQRLQKRWWPVRQQAGPCHTKKPGRAMQGEKGTNGRQAACAKFRGVRWHCQRAGARAAARWRAARPAPPPARSPASRASPAPAKTWRHRPAQTPAP